MCTLFVRNVWVSVVTSPARLKKKKTKLKTHKRCLSERKTRFMEHGKHCVGHTSIILLWYTCIHTLAQVNLMYVARWRLFKDEKRSRRKWQGQIIYCHCYCIVNIRASSSAYCWTNLAEHRNDDDAARYDNSIETRNIISFSRCGFLSLFLHAPRFRVRRILSLRSTLSLARSIR